MSGVLAGYRVIEMAAIGPVPLCGMLLADMGADVVRVDRPTPNAAPNPTDFCGRGKRSIALDLKSQEGKDTLSKLIASADALIEGFRPGVMERLGFGPEQCHGSNPKLVFGRMTGWGQDGPLANSAGHDLNYIALTGALGAMGRAGEPPAPPLNLVGDYGGGTMFLALGVVAGILHAHKTGEGQVIDAAMTDGASVLMTMIYGMKAAGFWHAEQQTNLLDGTAHFYDTYKCADGKFFSLGAIEPQFYAEFRALTGLHKDAEFDAQMARGEWGKLKEKVAAVFATKSRDDWASIFEGTDACAAPVLDMEEAPHHHHNIARETFVEANGFSQPAPAPRFSGTSSAIGAPPPYSGQHTDEILSELAG